MSNGHPTTNESLQLVGQRVSQLGEQVDSLAKSVNAFVNRSESRFEQADTKITSVSETLNDRLSNVRNEITQARVPQWQVVLQFIATGVTVGGALWLTGVTPVKEDIARLEQATATIVPRSENQSRWDEFQRGIIRNADEINGLRESRLSKAEYANDVLARKQDVANLLTRLEGMITTIDTRVRENAAAVVPRGEHQERWRSEQEARAAIQRQVDEVKQAMGGIYGARDVIQDLQRRLDRVEHSDGPTKK